MAKKNENLKEVDKVKLPEGVNQDQIAALKKMHKKRIFLIEQELFDGEQTFVLARDIDDKTFMAATDILSSDDINSVSAQAATDLAELLFNELVVFNGEQFADDIRFRISIGSQLGALMQVKRAHLKKL